MKIKETYCCSYCSEEFQEEDKCLEHQKICDKFKGEFEGMLKLDYTIGYPIVTVGGIDLFEIAEMLKDKIIKIQIVEPKLKLCKRT